MDSPGRFAYLSPESTHHLPDRVRLEIVMPRVAWSRLVIALIALPLVSCFEDAGDCPTCPPLDGGRIEVLVPQAGLVDSIHVRLDGGSQVTVRRNRRHAFEGLSEGTHEVTVTRWFYILEVLSSQTSTLQIQLARGETRTVVFHADFPRVTWAPKRDTGPGDGRGPNVSRAG